MALVKLSTDGQEITLPDAIANDDKQLKAALTPFYPEMANALINRSTNSEGQVVVTMTKQAGTKGSVEVGVTTGNDMLPVLNFFEKAPQELNPALRVSWRLQYMQALDQLSLEDLIVMQPKIEAALYQGEMDATTINKVAETLRDCPAQPAAKLGNIPSGF